MCQHCRETENGAKLYANMQSLEQQLRDIGLHNAIASLRFNPNFPITGQRYGKDLMLRYKSAYLAMRQYHETWVRVQFQNANHVVIKIHPKN